MLIETALEKSLVTYLESTSDLLDKTFRSFFVLFFFAHADYLHLCCGADTFTPRLSGGADTWSGVLFHPDSACAGGLTYPPAV